MNFYFPVNPRESTSPQMTTIDKKEQRETADKSTCPQKV